MKKWEEKAIKKIMKNFDFERMHEHMIKTDWMWFTPEGFRIPCIQELRKQAERLLILCAEENADSTGTGGFTVHRDDEGKELVLEFCVVEASNID